MHSEEFPARLRHLRTARNLSQHALAETVGVTRMSINNYENGNRTPSISVAARLADVLDVTVDDLIGRRPVVDPPPIVGERLDNLRRAVTAA